MANPKKNLVDWNLCIYKFILNSSINKTKKKNLKQVGLNLRGGVEGGGGINTNPAKGNERKEILHIWNLCKDRGEEYRTGVNIHNNQTLHRLYIYIPQRLPRFSFCEGFIEIIQLKPIW